MRIKIRKAKNGRKIPGIGRYWYSKRLTLKENPCVIAWLWWNIYIGK